MIISQYVLMLTNSSNGSPIQVFGPFDSQEAAESARGDLAEWPAIESGSWEVWPCTDLWGKAQPRRAPVPPYQFWPFSNPAPGTNPSYPIVVCSSDSVLSVRGPAANDVQVVTVTP